LAARGVEGERRAGLNGLRKAAKKLDAAVYTPERGIEGRGDLVVARRADLERLSQRLEDAVDIRDAEAALAVHRPGRGLSGAAALALIRGEHPIKVWRTERRMTQAELAKRAELTQPFIAQIEARVREPTLAALRALAAALDVDLDDLIADSR